LEHDALPEAPAPLPPPPTSSSNSMASTCQPATATQPAGQSHLRNLFRTAPDIFGRYRVYHTRPSTIPDANMPMAHILPASNSSRTSHSPRHISDIISPCPNITVFYVLRYHWLSGNSKSIKDRDYLCNEVLLQPDFNPSDLVGVNLDAVESQLAAAAKNWDPTCPPAEGWKNIPLRLRVPTPRAAARSQLATKPHDNYVGVSGYRARSLTDLMKKTFATNDPDTFHYEPFEHRWKLPGSSGPAQTLSGEMYTSPVMIKAHREVQSLDIACDLPRCVAGFMFASDGMQFASFSHVKVAHIPTLPDKVKEQITEMHGKPPTEALLTHLRRELMHAVWVALLDNEFIEAWRTGVIILCADDYPEKEVIQSKAVEDLLKAESYVPTTNAFSDRLRDFKFDVFSTMVVDQLHEVELGVWKTLFRHLIRLLYRSGPQALAEFNRRFRRVPTFASTIRMFAEDVADMGRIAARDFEDILQCCMPVFKGLLPEECDELVQTLLFLFAEWHGLVKLRLHTSATLKIFKSVTSKLGTALRNFAKLTASMEVRETPKEYARRKKQSEASKALSMTRRTSTTHVNKAQPQQNSGDGRRICTLNLDTYKMHSFGDYPGSIEEYGTTDSYSTQIGELQNRTFKAQYLRTNKRNAVEQMTEINDITAALRDIDKELQGSFKAAPVIDSGAIDSLVGGQAYFVGQKERSEDCIPNIPMWVANQPHDNAVKLKRHLLGRIQGNPNRTDFSNQELAQLNFYRGRMYRHKTLRVNYTSYDVLRQQDVLNSGTPGCFVMLLAESEQEPDAHPFIYAKVLGVYHANIVYHNRPPQRMDFVHVRWLYYDYERPGGWDHKRLDRVAYGTCDTNDDILDSFDFIDPGNILRATHLIPDFCSDTTRDLLGQDTSIAYDDAEFGDWKGYYVNRYVVDVIFWLTPTFVYLSTRFVDRDMLMRYIGGGVGHYRQSIGKTAINADEIQEVIRHDEDTEVHEDHDDEDGDAGEYGNGMEQEGLDAGLTEYGEDDDEEEEEDEEDMEGDDNDDSDGDDIGEDDDLYGF
ncbi:hypothetical protein FRC06_001731, partial [Ceratobasidium sp. 370]